MGTVMTKLAMWNNTDLEDANRGLVPPNAVRSVTLEALVDTGAMTLVIPEEAARALGLSLIGHRPATLADGTKRQIPVMGALRIEILGRQMICDALVTPAGTTALIGQIPLEELDLIVDPGSREARVRSPDGPPAWLLRLAA
jgi:clan AA aspartic protease